MTKPGLLVYLDAYRPFLVGRSAGASAFTSYFVNAVAIAVTPLIHIHVYWTQVWTSQWWQMDLPSGILLRVIVQAWR